MDDDDPTSTFTLGDPFCPIRTTLLIQHQTGSSTHLVHSSNPSHLKSPGLWYLRITHSGIPFISYTRQPKSTLQVRSLARQSIKFLLNFRPRSRYARIAIFT